MPFLSPNLRYFQTKVEAKNRLFTWEKGTFLVCNIWFEYTLEAHQRGGTKMLIMDNQTNVNFDFQLPGLMCIA